MKIIEPANYIAKNNEGGIAPPLTNQLPLFLRLLLFGLFCGTTLCHYYLLMLDYNHNLKFVNSNF